MGKAPSKNEIEVTDEMIAAGVKVLDDWFNENWPEITPQADRSLVEEILLQGGRNKPDNVFP